MRDTLTPRSIENTPVLIPLKRPVGQKVGLYRHWPLLLIDLHTDEGVVGRRYLDPYLEQSARFGVEL